jgi:hypothetical protein
MPDNEKPAGKEPADPLPASEGWLSAFRRLTPDEAWTLYGLDLLPAEILRRFRAGEITLDETREEISRLGVEPEDRIAAQDWIDAILTCVHTNEITREQAEQEAAGLGLGPLGPDQAPVAIDLSEMTIEKLLPRQNAQKARRQAAIAGSIYEKARIKGGKSLSDEAAVEMYREIQWICTRYKVEQEITGRGVMSSAIGRLDDIRRGAREFLNVLAAENNNDVFGIMRFYADLELPELSEQSCGTIFRAGKGGARSGR